MPNLSAVLANCEQALKLNPEHAELRCQYAQLLYHLGRVHEAEIEYKKIQTHCPLESALGLGLIARQHFQFDKALTYFHQAQQRSPQTAAVYTNIGALYADQCNYDQAEKYYQKALQITPNHLDTLYNLAQLARDRMDYPNAIAQFQLILKQHPDHAYSHFSLGLCYLAQGNYELGWPEYEWRWQRPDLQTRKAQMVKPQWQGEDLTGQTLLVHAEQGFGDTLQFARFFPLLKQYHPAKTILVCRPPLLPLLKQQNCFDEYWTTDDPLPPHDKHIPDMSLAYALKITLRNLPTQPYLPSFCVSSAGSKRIGFVWSANPQNSLQFKSCQLADFEPLFNTPNTTWFNLQKDIPVNHPNVFNPPLNDFAATAAIIQNLDLVMTVDTAVAHLAGAMGKPVWLLLALPIDWRWISNAGRSLWYPSIQLFPQTEFKNWQPVLQHLQDCLKIIQP